MTPLDGLPTAGLHGRKQVRLRLRPNVVIAPDADGVGQVVKDPITLAYFRLDAKQHFVVRRMDGRHTLGDIQQAYADAFRPATLALEELEEFAAQLLEAGLAQNDAPDAANLLLARESRQRRQRFLSAVLNPFCVRIPLFDPTGVLDALLPVGRVLFSRWFAVVSLALAGGLLGVAAAHAPEIRARLPEVRELLTFRSLVCLWAALGLVKVLHELAHGLSCRVFGGKVQEMGVLVLFFFPTLYCDVSDGWTIPGRRRRMAVGAAGMYVELLVAAVATLLWWKSDPASALHQLSLAVVLVCAAGTLVCNANPLMRFDGYFILADGLDAPNLAETADRHAQAAVLRWLGVATPVEPPPGRTTAAGLVVYAVASRVYRGVILCGALYALGCRLHDYRLGSVASLLAGVAAAAVVAGPVVRLVRAVRARGRLPGLKVSRATLALTAGAAAFAAVFVVPFPYCVQGLALIQPEPAGVRRVVVPDAGGFLRELHVYDGQRVRAGEVLAVIENPKLEIRLRVAEAEQALRLQQVAAHVAAGAESARAGEAGGEAAQRTAAELQAVEKLQTTLREQADRLVLRAPCDGVVAGLADAEDRGKWFEKGAVVCSVGDDRRLRAVVLVEPADRRLVTVGAPAGVRVHGGGGRTGRGTVTAVAPADAKDIPAALSHHAGGDVSTRRDPGTSAEAPTSQQYVVTVELRDAPVMIQPGVRGRVRLDAGSHTVWWRVQRYLATTFGWGL